MAIEGIITWRGNMGSPKNNHKVRAVIKKVTSRAALNTLATTLATTYTDCYPIMTTWLEKGLVWASDPPGIPNVDLKAVIYFRDDDSKVLKMTLPAPKASIIEDTPQGERLTTAAVEAIVGLINTATGESYTALYGVVVQSK